MNNEDIKYNIKKLSSEGMSNLEIKKYLAKKGVSSSVFNVNMHELGRDTILRRGRGKS